MPRRVNELLASWREQLGHHPVLKKQRLAPLYFIWGIWREPNTRSFEDRETMMIELKKMMFQSLYTWRVAQSSWC
jgi:hypothetical protein